MYSNKQTKEVTTYTSLLLGYLVIPIIILILSPVYILRLIVQTMAKKWKPELGEMLSDNSSIFATLDSNPTCAGVVCLILENCKVDLFKVEEIGEIILSQDKFIKAKQTLVKWMGFFFWKNNPQKFSLKEHLILHEQPVTKQMLDVIRERDFIDNPLSKDKPLWEMHIFSNFIPEKTEKGKTYVAMALRMHHSLLDWFSFMDVTKEINKIRSMQTNSDEVILPSGISSSNNNKSVQTTMCSNSQNTVVLKPNVIQIILYCMKLIIFGPFEFVESFRKCVATTLGNFIVKTPSKKYHSFETSVPLEYVKEIGGKNKVKTVAVTLAAMGGALRQLLIDLGVHRLPESVVVAGPVPLPGRRPEGLNNYFVGIPIQLPIREEDPFKRLHILHKEFEALQYSTRPLAYYVFFSLLGGLCHWMIKPLARSATRSASFSIAPGPSNLSELIGLKIVDFLPTGGMPYGDVVILGFYSLSMNNQLYLRVTGDEILFPEKVKSKRFIDLILREFEILRGK